MIISYVGLITRPVGRNCCKMRIASFFPFDIVKLLQNVI